MNRTKNDLALSTRKKVCDLLDPLLVDAVDLYTRCKDAHWNVKGPSFAALHELFDEIATDVLVYADDLAERMVELGGTAEATARDVAKKSSLAPAKKKAAKWQDHVERVAGALASFGGSVRTGIDEAAKLGDADAADLLTEISRGVDKWLWQVEAHLEK